RLESQLPNSPCAPITVGSGCHQARADHRRSGPRRPWGAPLGAGHDDQDAARFERQIIEVDEGRQLESEEIDEIVEDRREAGARSAQVAGRRTRSAAGLDPPGKTHPRVLWQPAIEGDGHSGCAAAGTDARQARSPGSRVERGRLDAPGAARATAHYRGRFELSW